MSWFQREVARVLGRGRGEVRALQDLIAIEGVLRFTAVYGITVLIPALVLSYFALSSIRAEELYVDADIERRAEVVVEQVHHEAEGSFGRFEGSTRDRLAQNQSPLTALADLSPYLRAAFRFDANGNLVAPFALPQSDGNPEPNAFYRRTFLEARGLEQENEFRKAAERFRAAARAANSPALAGEAELARAGAIRRAGFAAEAEVAYTTVYADYANLRDQYGFQIGDRAALELALVAAERDPELGYGALTDLVDKLLAAKWTIGRPGEAAVARLALAKLERTGADPDWLGRSRTRLDERKNQLYWAERLSSGLALLIEDRSTGQRSDPGEFRYTEQREAGALWATVWWNDDLYAFAFDHVALVRDLAEAARHADSLDADVRAMLLTTTPPQHTIVARTLQPWFPTLTVAVGPIDPEGLVATKQRKRVARIVIVLIAVGMSIVGVVLAARLLNRELESAKMKADFAANVSHELRSPITQIRLKGEALQLGLIYDDTDRQAHYDAIVHESERLSRLVDNVLDFSSIERGAKRYTFRPEDLGEIVQNSVESARNTLESRGLDIELDVPDDLPVIWVDREAVSQVITNLLSNAAKYGAEGGWVGIRARRSGDHHVKLAISDKGIGIPAEEQARIFDRFYRSADPKVRRFRGTGIGLTIVRYIVEEHGGEIRVDSTPGNGTTFFITFPLEPRESGA